MAKCKDCEFWHSKNPEGLTALGDCSGPVPEAVEIKIKRQTQGHEGSDCKAFVKGK